MSEHRTQVGLLVTLADFCPMTVHYFSPAGGFLNWDKTTVFGHSLKDPFG